MGAWNWSRPTRQLLVCGLLNLSRLANNDFGMAVVRGDGPMDFHSPAGQGAQITKLLAIGREDYTCEGTVVVIVTEVQKSIATAGREHLYDVSGDAARFSGVPARLTEVNAA